MSLHPPLQHVVTDFSKIRYKRCAHICEFRENLRSESRTCVLGATDSTHTHTHTHVYREAPPLPSQETLKLEAARLGPSYVTDFWQYKVPTDRTAHLLCTALCSNSVTKPVLH